MNLTKLGSIGLCLARKNLLFRRLPVHESKTQLRFKNDKSVASGKKGDDDNDEEFDKPIKYSTSKAASWDPRWSRTGYQDDRPWFQGYIVLASIGVVLIYFCVLREENDIDEKLTWDLADHFEGEKKETIKQSQRFAIELSQGYIRK